MTVCIVQNIEYNNSEEKNVGTAQDIKVSCFIVKCSFAYQNCCYLFAQFSVILIMSLICDGNL